MKCYVNYYSHGKTTCDDEANIKFVDFLPHALGLVACEKHAREYVSSTIKSQQEILEKFSKRVSADLEKAIEVSKQGKQENNQ